MKRKRTKKSPLTGIHIAVIVPETIREDDVFGLSFIASKRKKGDWASFIGLDRDMVITKAREAVVEWNGGEYAPNAPYTILVGTITSRVQFPINFKVVPL